MTEVMSSQGMVPMPLLTMHGPIHDVDGASTIVGAPCASPSCLRVLRAPRARWKHATGGQAPLMMPRGLGRDGEMSPKTPIVPEASLQGSGEIEFVIRVLSG
jgi:hypothetical protein